MTTPSTPGQRTTRDPLAALRSQVEHLVKESAALAHANLPPQGTPRHRAVDPSRTTGTPPSIPPTMTHPWLELLPMPALLLNPQGGVQEANHHALAHLRNPTDQGPPANVNLLDLLDPPSRQRLKMAMQHSLAKQTIHGLRMLTHAAQQHTDIWLAALQPEPPHSPLFLAILTVHPPDTSLTQDTHLLRALQNNAEVCLSACDTEGRFLLANAGQLRLMGRTLDEVQGQDRGLLLPLRDSIEASLHDKQVMSSGAARRQRQRLHTPDGTQVHDVYKFPLRNEAGDLVGVGALSLDITEETQAQEWQVVSEKVFLNSREAILLTDPKGHIVRVNPAFTTMSGFSADAVMGRKLSLLHSGLHDQAFYQAMWADISARGHWQGEITNRAANGSHYVVWTSINSLRNDEGHLLGYVAIESDLTTLRLAHEQLRLQATTDPLTGLPNRSLFMERLRNLIAMSKRNRQPFALLFADLDHFKEVNDTLGHHVGDDLLGVIAQRLRDSLREQDTVARLGGDEFVALLPNTQKSVALTLAQRLHDHLGEPVTLDNMPDYRPLASIGLVSYPEDGETPDTLMRNADQAMYSAKHNGRNQLHAYEEGLATQNRATFNLHQELRGALDKGELRVFWQPKFHLRDRAFAGAEALIRWQHPRLGLLSPGAFLPVAEEHQMLQSIDQWMLQHTLQQLSTWIHQRRWPMHCRASINQTALDLQNVNWCNNLQSLLSQLAVSPDCVEIELSESVWAHTTLKLLENLRTLRDWGVSLSIDDFGAGYSNLAYLRTLPAKTLKIDQSFVREMTHNDHDKTLVEMMVGLASKLGFEVVAEGIETQEQCDQLMQLGCALGQGYLISPPVSTDEFEARFIQNTVGGG